MDTFNRRLKVGKTDAFILDVSSWLSNESITSYGVSCSDGGANVVSSSVDGSEISALITGVTAGVSTVTFEFSTSTRSNCKSTGLIVIASC